MIYAFLITAIALISYILYRIFQKTKPLPLTINDRSTIVKRMNQEIEANKSKTISKQVYDSKKRSYRTSSPGYSDSQHSRDAESYFTYGIGLMMSDDTPSHHTSDHGGGGDFGGGGSSDSWGSSDSGSSDSSSSSSDCSSSND